MKLERRKAARVGRDCVFNGFSICSDRRFATLLHFCDDREPMTGRGFRIDGTILSLGQSRGVARHRHTLRFYLHKNNAPFHDASKTTLRPPEPVMGSSLQTVSAA